MKKMDEKSKKTGIIRLKAGDLLNLLKNSNEDDDVIRLVQIFSDYDPEAEIVVQLTDKTGEK